MFRNKNANNVGAVDIYCPSKDTSLKGNEVKRESQGAVDIYFPNTAEQSSIVRVSEAFCGMHGSAGMALNNAANQNNSKNDITTSRKRDTPSLHV